MPHVVLHIGTGKTGSTAIQEAFSASTAALSEAGVSYVPGAVGHHNELEVLVLPPEQWHRVHRVDFGPDPEVIRARARQLVDSIRASLRTHAAAVVSSEYLHSLPRRAVRELLRLFQDHGVVFSAVIYVRRPSSYVLSSLQQFLKLEHDIVGALLNPYAFEKSIANWQLLLGRAGLRVREFGSAALPGGDVVADFVAVLQELVGVTLPPLVTGDVENASFSAEACIVMQELKRDHGVAAQASSKAVNQAINAAVGRAARRMSLTRLQFHSGIADLIDRHHHEALQMLRDDHGITFGANAEPLDEAGRRELERLARERDFAALVAHDPGALAALRAESRAALAANLPPPVV